MKKKKKKSKRWGMELDDGKRIGLTYDFGIGLELIGDRCPKRLKPGNVGDDIAVVAPKVVGINHRVCPFGVGNVVDDVGQAG